MCFCRFLEEKGLNREEVELLAGNTDFKYCIILYAIVRQKTLPIILVYPMTSFSCLLLSVQQTRVKVMIFPLFCTSLFVVELKLNYKLLFLTLLRTKCAQIPNMKTKQLGEK